MGDYVGGVVGIESDMCMSPWRGSSENKDDSSGLLLACNEFSGECSAPLEFVESL